MSIPYRYGTAGFQKLDGFFNYLTDSCRMQRCQFLIGTVQLYLVKTVRNNQYSTDIVCQFLIGTVQHYRENLKEYLGINLLDIVSIPYRYGTA